MPLVEKDSVSYASYSIPGMYAFFQRLCHVPFADTINLTGEPLERYARRPGPLLEPASDESMQLARAWLNACSHGHKRCAPYTGPHRPAWLINVSPPDSEPDTIKLVRPGAQE